MADCFISYSSEDEEFADYVASELRAHGLSVFHASDSLNPGDDWSEEIKRKLNGSTWVIQLASRMACQSPWVQQELGMAVGGSKTLIPVVWDMPPNELPGWAPESQALDLRGADPDETRRQVVQLAERLRRRKQGRLLTGAAFLGGLFFIGSQG